MARWGTPPVYTCPDCGLTGYLNGAPHVCAGKGGYAPLERVLTLALQQASEGKGKDRHANGKPFDRQPMLEIARMVGPGFCLGQAIKKAQESSRMPPEAAKRELLGAINYLAGAYLLLEETQPT